MQSEMQSLAELKYWAFVSYSHRDKTFGKWLHRSLENLRVPKEYVGQESDLGVLPSRLTPIFRDEDELPISADLNANIQEALEQSKCLIVVCSPNSAQSHWVQEEVLAFKRLGRDSRILPIIIHGQPNASDDPDPKVKADECFCDALRYSLDAEGNLSEHRTEPIAGNVCNTDKRVELTRLAAGVMGVGFDALFQRQARDERRRMLRRLALACVIAVSLLVLSVAALLARSEAQKQRDRAELESERHRRAHYFSQVAFAEAEARRGELDSARQLLLDCPLDLRNWELYHVWHLQDQSLRNLVSGKTAALSVAASPTAPKLVVGHKDGQLLVVSRRDGKVLERSPKEVASEEIRRVAYSPDGAHLVSVGKDGQLRIWSTEKFRLLHTIKDLKSGINSAAWSPLSNSIAAVGADNRLTLWNVTGEKIRSMEGDLRRAYAISFDGEGQRIAVADGLPEVRLWDAISGRLIHALGGHPGGAFAAALSHDGHWLATADSQGVIIVWNTESGLEAKRLTGHKGYVYTLDWSAEGDRLVSGGEDGTVRIWDFGVDGKMTTLRGHDKAVRSVGWLGYGGVVSASDDGSVKLWNTSRSQSAVLTRGTLDVADVVFADDNKAIASVTVPGLAGGRPLSVVRSWNISNGYGDAAPKSQDSEVVRLAAAADRLVLGNADGRIRVLDATPDGVGRELPQINELGQLLGPPVCLEVSGEGNKLFAAGKGQDVAMWDIESGKRLPSPAVGPNGVCAADLLFDGSLLCTGEFDGRIRFWDVESGQLKWESKAHQGAVTAVRFAAGSRFLASGGADERIRYWDIGQRETILDLAGLGGAVTSLDLNPDGSRIVSGFSNGSVRLWDTLTGQVSMVLREHRGEVIRVRFSRSGGEIVTAARDGSVRLWHSTAPRLVPDPSADPFSADR